MADDDLANDREEAEAAEEPGDEDPTLSGGDPIVLGDFSDLKTALGNVKTVLTPYDWIEFVADFETSRALGNKVAREERAKRIADGIDSDDEEPTEREKRQQARVQDLSLCEHLKSRIVEVHGYFADVVQSLLACHSHLAKDFRFSKKFVQVLKHVPKNSRDAVERLTEKNNILEAQVTEYEK